MKPGVVTMPEEIDDNIASLQLRALGVKMDVLSQEQVNYMNSWQEGT
jgi:adenosylhomocysteinase